ncbi:MAG: hypothetical protein J6C84_00515 [Lachnospiraceae bacterium]|nr:hypothetical protein [Lachnospiraceae bacterium]
MARLKIFCVNCIAVLGGMIFLFLTFYAWSYTKSVGKWEIITTLRDNIGLHLAALGAALGLALLLDKVCRGFSDKALHIAVFCIAVAVPAILLLIVHNVSYYAEADQYYVYLAASQMVEGSFDMDMLDSYFRVYPYQLGLAWTYAFFFRLFGTCSYQVLQSVNAVCVGISVYAGFRITRELFPGRAARVWYLICALCFLPLPLYALFIYGESMGVCGSLLAIWGFLGYNRPGEEKGKKIGWWVMTVLSVSFAYLVRGALIIVWIAMAIIQFLLFLENKRWKALFMTLLILAAALGSSSLLQSQIERNEGTRLNQGMPAVLCMAMGLQENPEPGKGQGTYNNYDWNLYQECGLNGEVAKAYALENIRERFSEWADNPADAVVFFKEKLLNQWTDPTFNVFVMTDNFEERPRWVEEIYKKESQAKMSSFLNSCQSVAYLALLAYFIRLAVRKKTPLACLPGLILIGGFLFSAIWEAKGRYVYPYVVMALPCIAGSLADFGQSIRTGLEGRWKALR